MSARVLVAETLSETGLAVLKAAGHDADVGRISPARRSSERSATTTRSSSGRRTQVDEALLTAGRKLRVVGRAGVGLDNVDVKAATERGVLVVNAPSGNVVSAAEHAIALLLALLRRIPEAQVSLKAGEWKRTKFVGTELAGEDRSGSSVSARSAPASRRASGRGT